VSRINGIPNIVLQIRSLIALHDIGYEPEGVFFPRGNFLHYFLLKPNVSWAFFTRVGQKVLSLTYVQKR